MDVDEDTLPPAVQTVRNNIDLGQIIIHISRTTGANLTKFVTDSPTRESLQMWLLHGYWVAMHRGCADLRIKSCGKLENKILFICMVDATQLHGGCMNAA